MAKMTEQELAAANVLMRSVTDWLIAIGRTIKNGTQDTHVRAMKASAEIVEAVQSYEEAE